MICSKVRDQRNSQHAVHFKSANQRFATVALQTPNPLRSIFELHRVIKSPERLVIKHVLQGVPEVMYGLFAFRTLQQCYMEYSRCSAITLRGVAF